MLKGKHWKTPPSVVCIDMRILITESHNATLLTTSCDDKENKINGSDPRVMNGTIGVVFAISPPSGTLASISVRLENGNEYKIRQIRTNGRGALYWPFRPSYATTFHKVQGMTLKHVFIDTHHTMMDGMFYVGSSRVRAAEGLHIVGPTPSYIKYNRKVLEEQRRIEAASIIPLV